jgi:hypothetical protein
MVATRSQAKKADEKLHDAQLKTQAIPGEEDSTVARWPPPAPMNSSKRRGGQRRSNNDVADWADLPESCLLRVFELLNAEEATHAVSGLRQR